MSDVRTCEILTHEGPVDFDDVHFGECMVNAIGNIFEAVGLEDIDDCSYSFTPYQMAYDSLYLQVTRRSTSNPTALAQCLKFKFGIDDKDDLYLYTTVMNGDEKENLAIQLMNHDDDVRQLHKIAIATAQHSN